MGSFAMVTTSIYLDHASATPLDERARAALLAALDEFADPLRVHGDGLAAKRLLDDARATVAGALGAQPDEIVFTSGGTESVALAIWGGVRPVRELGTRVVTTTIEHPSVGGVLHTLETDGVESVLVAVHRSGAGAPPRPLPRGPPPRNPGAGHPPAARGGPPPVPRGRRAVPHRRLPERRAPAR